MATMTELDLGGGYTYIHCIIHSAFCMFKIVPQRKMEKINLAPPLLTLPELVSQGWRWGVEREEVDLLFVKPGGMISFLV